MTKTYQQKLDELAEAILVAESKARAVMRSAPEGDMGRLKNVQAGLSADFATVDEIRERHAADK